MSLKNRSPEFPNLVAHATQRLLANGKSEDHANNIPLMNACLVEESEKVPANASTQLIFTHFLGAIGTVLHMINHPYEAELLQRYTNIEDLGPILAQRFDVQDPVKTYQNFVLLCEKPQ